MSKRSPNAEQLLAIEHDGGVLLRAGAGSGKTFVLVEHIVYLTQKWMKDFSPNHGQSFEEHLRQKFSEVVMMTFTKKAAGEMSIRLAEKFAELSLTDENWKTANEALPMLMVTTIDGFCRKLITSGYFPHLSTEAKIIFDTERIDQVKQLLTKWFEVRSSHISPEVLDIVIREKNDLLRAFSGIFNDPGLRLSWKKFNPKDADSSHVGKIISASFKLNDIASALHKIQSLDLPIEKERSAFEKFVGEVQSCGLPEVTDVDKLNLYWPFFEGKTLRGEASKTKKTPAHEAAHQGLKDLREWLKEWVFVCRNYEAHYESKVLPWLKLCQELFQWIDEGLDPNAGMTFGDIAYFVALGLEDKENRERIQKIFRYFIVDEFQDTSALQFKIIRLLIGEDFSRLFCVGDAKQAIYGFRGGELSVFQDCGELVPKVLSLANNYRSLPEVIHFNNSLFRTLLPLGQEFTGHDPFSVNPEDQNVPSEVTAPEEGSIEILSATLPRTDEEITEKKKFTPENINRLEACLLAESIESMRREKPSEVCTILYTKLKPSAELIRELMKRKVGFTAQFKIDLLDDPVIGIFVSLLRRQFDTNSETKNTYPLFMLKSYLSILGLPGGVTIELLNKFDLDVTYWGLLEAFRKFIHALGISNENSDINLDVLEVIAELYHQDREQVMNQLIRGKNDRISLDLRSGENSHMVQIMTAHASKGLEFDNVYLGGIYTNGREKSDGSLFGEMPGSFRWFLDLSKREKEASPTYVFEQELDKYKSFSESKRLFYVACTRAKKRLYWVDFHISRDDFNIPANSWIDGLNAWVNSGMTNEKVVEKPFPDFDWRKILNGESLPQLPLFFHDPVGIFPKQNPGSELTIAAELSVTRLNDLVDCPRKFYMSNILKLDVPEKESKTYFPEEEGEELAVVMKSSADRGTHIHAQIAKGIERNFIVPRESFSGEEREPIQWTLDQLKVLNEDFELISEKQVKFKFFNFMISGIPDLILMPRENNNAQVWDFKTGRITQENLSHYWFQLSSYAYALYVLERIPKSQTIELVLCFVDQKKLIKETVSWKRCVEKLYPVWRSQNEPWKTNPDHCAQCSYGSICPR